MSRSLLRPDFKADIAALARRIATLERRTTPAPSTPASAVGHTHDGTGTDSIVLSNTADPAIASGTGSLAGGDGAEATGTNSTVYGHGGICNGNNGSVFGGGYVDAAATQGVSIGDNSAAWAPHSAAFGADAQAFEDTSTAVGYHASTDDAHQIMLGRATEYVEIPSTTGIVLHSANGSRWRVTISNAGVLSVAAA